MTYLFEYFVSGDGDSKSVQGDENASNGFLNVRFQPKKPNDENSIYRLGRVGLPGFFVFADQSNRLKNRWDEKKNEQNRFKNPFRRRYDRDTSV